MWVWRDDLGSGDAGTGPGGWRLDAYGEWTWDEPSPLDRPGAGIGALRRPGTTVRGAGDRALATLAQVGEPTPIFHALTEDRDAPRRGYRDRDALPVPEPHPGSGPLPVQDPSGRPGRRLSEVPTVPPPAVGGSAAHADEAPESPEDELRRRAERRRRPRTEESAAEGGRHAWRREESRSGRHALRR